MTFGPRQETSYTAITLNQESNFTRREKNHSYSTEIHWRLQNYKDEFGCYARTPHRWLLEYRWIKRFGWFLDRFHSVYSIRWENSRRINVVRVETDKKAVNIQARLFMARTLDEIGKKCQAEREAENGQMKNQNSTMPEDYEEFTSLTLRTRSSKKPARMLARNRKRQWLPLCLARQARRTRVVRPVARLMRSNQNLRVFWKPVNPQECVWENLYRIIMKTILQEKETIHCNITIWYINLLLCLKQWRYPQQKHQWIKNGRNLKRFRRGTWAKSEVRNKWSMKQGRRAQKFILPHWWTSVIWRMPNWRQSTKSTKGRVVLRGDILKDDSGSYAVFTEQGSSASQMTPAKVMDVIAGLPDCDGQAADEISAYTYVKLEHAPRLLRIPKPECPDTWIRLPRHKWPKSWSSIDQWYLLNGICTDTHLRYFFGKDSSRKFCWSLVGKKYRIGNVYLFIENKDYSYVYTWMTAKWLERNRIWLPCERNWWTTWILFSPLHFLTTYIWDALDVNANRTKSFLNNTEKCLNHVFSAGATDPGGKHLTQKQSRGPTTWRDMPDNALRDTASWPTEKWSSEIKFQVLAWMTINSDRKNLHQLENYHKYAHKLSQNICIWHELLDQTFCGRSINLQEQSQNALRHVTDVWQDWLQTFITQMTTCNIVMRATQLSIVDWVYSKTQTLLATLRIRNQPREVCIFGSRTFVPTSWMCKNQTSVSQSSSESEIISLDAGLRMDDHLLQTSGTW